MRAATISSTRSVEEKIILLFRDFAMDVPARSELAIPQVHHTAIPTAFTLETFGRQSENNSHCASFFVRIQLARIVHPTHSAWLSSFQHKLCCLDLRVHHHACPPIIQEE
jgi:hypothetical protein